MTIFILIIPMADTYEYIFHIFFCIAFIGTKIGGAEWERNFQKVDLIRQYQCHSNAAVFDRWYYEEDNAESIDQS